MSETVTVGDIVLDGATVVEDSGGWQTTDKRVEEGFDYQSRVRREPIEATIEAWVDKSDVGELRDLRNQSEPVAASIGTLSISRAAIEDVSFDNEADVANKEQLTLELREQIEAEVESAEINIETDAGALGTAAGDTEPSTAQTEDNDGGEVEEETGGVVGALSSARQSLSGVF